MKTRNILLLVLLFVATAGLTSCRKDYNIWVSSQDLWFDTAAASQTIIVRADCRWTIKKADKADWYTVSPMSGSANDSIITITVEHMTEGDFRGSSFAVRSPGGYVRSTVVITQNKVKFEGLYNKVFSVMSRERWNTDYYGDVIEDTYRHYEYNPYDTTIGYQMYFLANDTGYQRDHLADTGNWWMFTYKYDNDNQILDISFLLSDDTTEEYSMEVLTASDSIFRFMHEFRPNFWERADMRRIGTIVTNSKAMMRRKAARRKERGPLFLE